MTKTDNISWRKSRRSMTNGACVDVGVLETNTDGS